MANHYHLLVETPLGNLSEFMRHFNISYTSHFNRRHNRVGNLFQGRYKSVLVDKDNYLSAVSKYIHLNPVKLRGFKTKPANEQMKYLLGYKWSSLPGFLNLERRYDFIEYGFVLEQFGGDSRSGRKKYMAQLEEDLHKGLTIKKEVVGQSILGSESFISWAKETFLDNPKSREQPGVGKLSRYIAQDKIIEQIALATDKSVEQILKNKGDLRQLAMELLYRFGGMKNKEIGVLMGVDYSTVSQGRKRLKDKCEMNSSLKALSTRIEEDLSKIKICPPHLVGVQTKV
jgi:DNA-binding CsgD family transcriptional regulator